jgi:SAM-dependent methyltransferase
VTAGTDSLAQYHYAYEQRRDCSTMADVARQVVSQNLVAYRSRLNANEPLRILSVGCGDGNLDLPVLQALSEHGPVEYLGLDINDVSLEFFASTLAIQGSPFPQQVRAELRNQTAEDYLTNDGDDAPVHVVLLAHVLYYAQDPVALVRSFQRDRLTPDGLVIVVHSGHRGIPEVLDDLEGLDSFLTAETLAEQLTAAGVENELNLVTTEMDVTDLLVADLNKDQSARQLLGFCLETDLDVCDPEVAELATNLLRARSHSRDQRLLFPEDLGFLVVHARVDPVEDYYQIAHALNWEQVLLRTPCSVDGRVRALDLGCGTGRWLNVLAATYPNIAEGKARHLHYSPLDPTDHALRSISPQVARLFTVDECLQVRAEQADLQECHYGLIWSVHSLYGVSRSDLTQVLAKVHAALVPEGTAYLMLADALSFYVRAAQEVLGEDLFRSAEDVQEALMNLGIDYQVHHVNYVERIPSVKVDELRHYLWAESIGHSYLPGSRHSDGTDDLPPLPDSDWWHSHRVGDNFEFPQNVQIITIRGGRCR